MKSIQNINKIITTLIIAGSISLSFPQDTQAVDQTPQTTPPTTQPALINTGRNSDAQAAAYNGDSSGFTTTGSGAGGAVSDALGCSAASLLGESIAMGLKSLISSTVGNVVSSLTTVPINTASDFNTNSIKSATEANTSINAIQQINGITYGASFNGIAYCIVNGLIAYIADSTIAWANSGFQGNPAFLENTEGFLGSLADRQASEFISSLGYNSTGINVCEPFRVDLAIALSESYGAQQNGYNPNRMSCSMDQVSQNFLNFANSGQDGPLDVNGYWNNWNQLRQDGNNPWSAYLEAGEYLRGQIAVKQNTAKFELGLNNGFLDFKKCEDKEAAKRGDTSSCKTYTPGRLIESSLNDTLRLGKERLVTAGKIDQVITALANALVKKALNTVLQKGE